MLRQIKDLILWILTVVSVGTVFMIAPTSVQASSKLVSKIPAKFTGVFQSNPKHMGAFERGKRMTIFFGRKSFDSKVWSKSDWYPKQGDPIRKVTRNRLKLVTSHPSKSEFMFAHVGKGLWNAYYIQSKGGRTRYITNHYWIMTPMYNKFGYNKYGGWNRIYKYETSTTKNKFNTQPLRGKHAVVSWSEVKNHGSQYGKTPF